MKTILNKYLKKLIILTLIIGLISFVVAFYMPQQYVSPAMPFLLAFFFCVAAFTYYLALNALVKRTSRFANFYMISVFAKLLVYVAIIVIYAFVNVADIVSFIITFFVYYLLFTSFETIEILKAQKLNK
jgi:hypothetical protein